MKRPIAQLVGTGRYTPAKILDNAYFESILDTSDEWIRERSGIRERRIAEKHETLAYMGAAACRQVLDDAGLTPLDVDGIVLGTASPDRLLPSTACDIQAELGAHNAAAFDVAAACSGFLYSLSVAEGMIASGQAENVLVVGGDRLSTIADYTDRTTCILFGDGAAAVLLEPSETHGVIDHKLHVDGTGANFLRQKAGGSLFPPSHETVDAREHFIYQDGQPVFKAAVKGMADVSYDIMQRNNLAPEDVAWLVPHQANLRIIDATQRRTGLPHEKVMINIQKYGNTTAATIPLCLHDWESQLKRGDNLILAAFGGGFTWGAVYLKWAYDGTP